VSRRPWAVSLALALAWTAGTSRDASAQTAPTRSESTARAVIVVGGVTVVVGIGLSWTGIAGLVWQATQHQSVPWAGPVGLTSIPVEVVGSALVIGGAVDLMGQRVQGSAWSEPAPPAVAGARPVLSVPLVRGEF
jgi:hypothetical protein